MALLTGLGQGEVRWLGEGWEDGGREESGDIMGGTGMGGGGPTRC